MRAQRDSRALQSSFYHVFLAAIGCLPMTVLFHSSAEVLAFSTITTSNKSTLNRPLRAVTSSKARMSTPIVLFSTSSNVASEDDRESLILNRRDALSKGALVAFSSLFLDASTAKKDHVDAAILEPVPKANAAVAIPMDTAAYPAKAAAVAETAKNVATTGRPPQLETLAALTFGPSAIALAGDATLSGRTAPPSNTRRVQRKVITTKATKQSFRLKFRRNVRTMTRILNIIALTTPALLRYPFARRNEESYRKWLTFVLKQLERGGAVMIKMAQWASSRPDIFGLTFCDVFKKLQDGTTPHSWSYTESVLDKAYGKDWRNHLKIEKENILGSGCIAQVYKGKIISPSNGVDENTGEANEQDVAIKVVHPNVRDGIEDDVSILRSIAKILESLPFGYGEKLRWNNIGGMVEEFSNMLKPQLDLQNEADHIQRFNENFANHPDVIFPKLVSKYKTHPDVLVETFCPGVPVEKFCEAHKDDVELRQKLCNNAAAIMCEMIFTHNFVHGDLHPGNVFVSPDNKLVLLDCGITNEYDDADHELMVNIIAAFIRMDGRKAAELMADDSNRRAKASGESAVQDVEKYISDIEKLSKTPRKSDFVFEKVVTYVDYIFNAAARHRVKMNSSFVSMMLAVKVQEGVALLLYPAVELMKIANPIILRSEAERIQMSVGQRMQQQVKDKMRDLRVKFDRERNKAMESMDVSS